MQCIKNPPIINAQMYVNKYTMYGTLFCITSNTGNVLIKYGLI